MLYIVKLWLHDIYYVHLVTQMRPLLPRNMSKQLQLYNITPWIDIVFGLFSTEGQCQRMRQPHPGLRQLEIRDHDAGQRPAPAWPQHCAAGLWKVKTSNTTSLHVWGGKGVKPQIPYRYSLVFVSWWYLISSRIGPLSDALGDLYKEFNALKERLGDLTVKFDDVEAFVDDVRAGRSPAPPRREPRPPAGKPVEENATNTEERRRPPGRRTRVVVRRIKKPAGSWASLIRRKWRK